VSILCSAAATGRRGRPRQRLRWKFGDCSWSCADGSEQWELVSDAFEGVGAAALEHDAKADHQLGHGPRDQDLSGSNLRQAGAPGPTSPGPAEAASMHRELSVRYLLSVAPPEPRPRTPAAGCCSVRLPRCGRVAHHGSSVAPGANSPSGGAVIERATERPLRALATASNASAGRPATRYRPGFGCGGPALLAAIVGSRWPGSSSPKGGARLYRR
jgi:hypothetical protein